MKNQNVTQEDKHRITPKPERKTGPQAEPPGAESPAQKVQYIQRRLGNRAVQRVLEQRVPVQRAPAQRDGSGQGGFSVDDETEQRINSQRGGGQPLDGAVRQQMQNAIGYDFSSVHVHNTPEASSLSKALQAKAFTTGSDVFFNEGQYQPDTSGGQELIAHELTHVAQQGTGKVPSGGSGMTVNAPNDTYEQEADATARQAVSASPSGAQASTAQRQEMPDEEEQLQTKPLEAALQRQEMPEEDELQTKPLQRQENDEEEQVA